MDSNHQFTGALRGGSVLPTYAKGPLHRMRLLLAVHDMLSVASILRHIDQLSPSKTNFAALTRHRAFFVPSMCPNMVPIPRTRTLELIRYPCNTFSDNRPSDFNKHIYQLEHCA